MKIAFFTDTYEPQVNGVVTSINAFREELEKEGHEVYVVCPKVKGQKYGKNVLPTRSLKFRPYPEYRFALPSITVIRRVRKIRPDIIHIHSPGTIGILGLLIAKMLQVPAIFTYHTNLEAYSSYIPGRFMPVRMRKFNEKVLTKLLVRFMKKVDVVIAPSKPTEEQLKKLAPKIKTRVVPTGLKIKLSKNSAKGRPTIFHLGRLCKERSVDEVIKGFEKLPIDGKLVIASTGPAEDELKELSKNLGIRNKVKFMGLVNEKEKNNLYRKADVFVIASTTDTQGLVVLEAMMNSTPVVAANAGGFKHYLTNGKNALLFEPHNIGAMNKATMKLLKDKKLRNKIVEGGYNLLKEMSIENCTEELLSIYKESMLKKIHSKW